MNLALQQTYYFEDGFRFIPIDGFPLKITGKQYHEAVRIIKEKGDYIPSEDHPNGEDDFKERKFLLEKCFVQLNESIQLYEGKNTKLIRAFAEESDTYSLEKLAEELNLPLPQWHLRRS